MMLGPLKLDKEQTKTRGVNPFDNTMNEHLILFGAFRDKIVEKKATDLPTLINAFSKFVIEQIRSMPEQVKAAAHMETHITEFENQNKEAATQLQTDHDATAKAMSRVEGKDDRYQPLIDYFVEVMEKDVNETKIGGTKTKKARKKSKKSKRRKTSKRKRSAGGPGVMVSRGPNEGRGWRWTFLTLIMFIFFGWYLIFKSAQSSYENDSAADADGIVAHSGWLLNQQDRTWTQFGIQYLTFTGEEQLANAYRTFNTLMYSISPRLSFIDGNIDHYDMRNFINNAFLSADINNIKFLFCDIVLYILTILTYIYYKARIKMARNPREEERLETEWKHTTDLLSGIKLLILVCWTGFRYITQGTTTLASRPRVLDGARLLQEGGPAAFKNVLGWRELFTDRHAIGLGGYFAWNQRADLLALGNGGARSQLGDGSGGGGSGTPQLGYASGGGGGSGSGSGWMRRRLGLRPPPPDWGTMTPKEKEKWRKDEQVWFQNNVSLKRGT